MLTPLPAVARYYATSNPQQRRVLWAAGRASEPLRVPNEGLVQSHVATTIARTAD